MASLGVALVVLAVGITALLQIFAYWRVNPRLVIDSLIATVAYLLFVGIGIGGVALAASLRRRGVGLPVVIFLAAWFALSLSLLVQYAPRPNRPGKANAGRINIVVRGISLFVAAAVLSWLVLPVFK